jgi:hypothetical protein
MRDDNEERLRTAIKNARRKIEPIGSMDPGWDLVRDADDWLAGRPARLPGTREEVLERLVKELDAIEGDPILSGPDVQ